MWSKDKRMTKVSITISKDMQSTFNNKVCFSVLTLLVVKNYYSIRWSLDGYLLGGGYLVIPTYLIIFNELA